MKTIAACGTFALALAVSGAARAEEAPPAARPDARTLATTVCAACHGPDGNSLVPLFPKLAGQQQVYLVKQLEDYKSGRRRNEVMATILKDVERDDFAALAAFYAEQKPNAGAIDDQALVARGRQLYANGDIAAGIAPCSACHEAKAQGDGRYPRLAGQSSTYATQTLTDLQSGTRHNDPGRVMRNISTHLGEGDIKALTAYLETQ